MAKLVVNELYAYLLAQGVVQANTAGPSLTVPSLWRNPRGGAPPPREQGGVLLENVTVTIADMNLAGPPSLATWEEAAFVNVTVRAKGEGEAQLVHRVIKNLIHPAGGALIGRRDWVMNTLRVLYSNEFRGAQPLPAVDNGKTYDWVATYQFRCARSDLA